MMRPATPLLALPCPGRRHRRKLGAVQALRRPRPFFFERCGPGAVNPPRTGAIPGERGGRLRVLPIAPPLGAGGGGAVPDSGVRP